jgi:hypothetical protein
VKKRWERPYGPTLGRPYAGGERDASKTSPHASWDGDGQRRVRKRGRGRRWGGAVSSLRLSESHRLDRGPRGRRAWPTRRALLVQAPAEPGGRDQALTSRARACSRPPSHLAVRLAPPARPLHAPPRRQATHPEPASPGRNRLTRHPEPIIPVDAGSAQCGKRSNLTPRA